MAVEFGLLGDVTASIDGRAIDLGPARRQCVLVALLVDPHHNVSVAELIERVWADRPPRRAREVLYSYISRLRQVLSAAETEVRIVGRSTGYVIMIDPMAVDLHRFRELLGQARAAGDEETQATLLDQALALWRGVPLGTSDSFWARTLREALGQERLVAELDRNDLALRHGRHADVLPELSTAADSHPFDERLAGQLMLALYRSGRQADALGHFQRVRRRLADELGADPSPALQQLHRHILNADASLVIPGRADATSTRERRAWTVPRQLPAPAWSFTGRGNELEQLDALLDRDGAHPAAVVISAVSGTAGVGKTALALEWAHRVADHFPDGQLYVDLRGYDSEQPMAVGDALAAFLRALDVDGAGIPPEPAERAGLYRTLLANRRMLVLLDNAASVEQIRLLLPGAASCVVVVTSRDRLAGLVARHGARRIDLDLLPHAEAVALLRALIGPRVDAEPDGAAALAEQCARLPLALRIAAELVVARSNTPLVEFVAELTDQQRRLDLLDAGGDPRTAVRAVFSWSYEHLTAAEAAAFRRLGLHPGSDLDSYAAAALFDTSVDQARLMLQVLDQAHLAQEIRTGRYGMHDLLRAYAAEMAAHHDTADDRQAALSRLFDHYLANASVAADTLYTAERHRRPRVAHPRLAVPGLTERPTARAWLDTERTTLVTVCAFSASHGWPAHANRLAITLLRYFDIGGYHSESLAVHTHALAAARQINDRAAEAHALMNLGRVYCGQGRYPTASDCLDKAMAIFHGLGDEAGQADVLNNLARVETRRTNYALALNYYTQALVLFQRTGDWWGECRVLGNRADVYGAEGRYALAAEHYQRALALIRAANDPHAEAYPLLKLGHVYLRQGDLERSAELVHQALAALRTGGDRRGEAHALVILGDAYMRQGKHERAAGLEEGAIAVCRKIGDPGDEAYALAVLGEVCALQGKHDLASAHLQQAATVAREIDDRAIETRALNSLGEMYSAIGQPHKARHAHASALSLGDQTGDRFERARAHSQLARIEHADGNLGAARRHSQAAFAIHAEMDVLALEAREEAGADGRAVDGRPQRGRRSGKVTHARRGAASSDAPNVGT